MLIIKNFEDRSDYRETLNRFIQYSYFSITTLVQLMQMIQMIQNIITSLSTYKITHIIAFKLDGALH